MALNLIKNKYYSWQQKKLIRKE